MHKNHARFKLLTLYGATATGKNKGQSVIHVHYSRRWKLIREQRRFTDSLTMMSIVEAGFSDFQNFQFQLPHQTLSGSVGSCETETIRETINEKSRPYTTSLRSLLCGYPL